MIKVISESNAVIGPIIDSSLIWKSWELYGKYCYLRAINYKYKGELPITVGEAMELVDGLDTCQLYNDKIYLDTKPELTKEFEAACYFFMLNFERLHFTKLNEIIRLEIEDVIKAVLTIGPYNDIILKYFEFLENQDLGNNSKDFTNCAIRSRIYEFTFPASEVEHSLNEELLKDLETQEEKIKSKRRKRLLASRKKK